ncbi:MAG: PA2779 family protein [Betaproteobacteria bacterium]|nr:PA2779 family protein [Betaproteobacteria bacterium]
MTSVLKNMICRFLAIALMMLPFQTGQASMIGADQLSPPAAVQVDRDLVLNYLSRSQVVNEFQTLGLDAQAAKDRVAAMTDDEVSALAGKISAVPAGADGGLALLVLVVFFIWYFAFRR